MTWYWVALSPLTMTGTFGLAALATVSRASSVAEGQFLPVEEDFPIVIHADRLDLGFRFALRRIAPARQAGLDPLHCGRGHQDEDHQKHVGEVQHRRDVDFIVRFIVLDLHGG